MSDGDRDIKDIFSRSREVDRSETPDFGSTRRRSWKRPPRRWLPRVAMVAGVFVPLLFAAWLMLTPNLMQVTESAKRKAMLQREISGLAASPPPPGRVE